jgi:hypothetical protein
MSIFIVRTKAKKQLEHYGDRTFRKVQGVFGALRNVTEFHVGAVTESI